MARFPRYERLQMVQPDFDSPITDLIIDLDYLRKRQLGGTTIPATFFQLKNIFHTLESIGSARIEGNNTTLAEYIETKIEMPETIPPGVREILNMENTMGFIDENIKEKKIDRAFISELHKMVVRDLEPPPRGEGDRSPGQYRTVNVKINRSDHVPPDALLINDYMDELYAFIDGNYPEKYDLLKAATSHHRFAWIHPFANGNGRTVRLLTYAMLVKMGFWVDVGHIINPTAVFCSDRNEYYRRLAGADSGEKEGILAWCEYVLRGLKKEIEKIDRLLDYQYLSKHVLIPTINYSLERKFINTIESKILVIAVEKQIMQASDIKNIFPQKQPSEISRQIRRLIERKMLQPVTEKGRKYVLSFGNNYLLRGIIESLRQTGFILVNE